MVGLGLGNAYLAAVLSLAVAAVHGNQDSTRLAIGYIGNDGDCRCAPGSGGKGQYGGGLDAIVARMLKTATKEEKIAYAKLKVEFAQRIVDANVNSAAEYAAAGNNTMVAKHAEIALLAAQEVGGLDALLHSVEPAAINPNAAGAASPAALRKAKAAKAAKASTPWWLEESALTAAHLLTSTQLDAAIRSGATKTLQRERLTTVEHTAAVPAVARDASAGVVKVGTGGFTLCKHQAHALEMVPPLGPSRAVAHVGPDLTADDFYWDYVIRGRPVVIGKGLLDKWPATLKWRKDAIVQHYPKVQLRVTRGAAPGDSDKDVDAAYSEPSRPAAGPSQQGGGGGGGGGEHDHSDRLEENAIPVPSAEDVERRWETFRKFIKSKEEDGWTFDQEKQALVLGDISIPCESPQNLEAFASQPGATTPIGPVRRTTMADFVTDVMKEDACNASNGTEVETRYVFNTLEGSPMEADFEVPALIRAVTDEMPGAFTACIHPRGKFEFFFGPAGSGAHLHFHPAAWNGLVHGRKRWVIMPPGKFQDNAELPSGKVVALEWFQKSLPIWREKFGEHLMEFVQEEGEVVYVPDGYGHAVLNLEPSIGVSKQMGIFSWPDGGPVSVLLPQSAV